MPSSHLLCIRVHSLWKTRDASYLQTSLLTIISFILYLVEPVPSLTASHGLSGSPRPPGTLNHSLFLRTKVVANSEYCRASLLLGLTFGPRYLRYYPLHEKLCATLAGVMRSCHERRTHRISSLQKYKNDLLRVVTAWSYPSAWNLFLWPPSASAL